MLMRILVAAAVVAIVVFGVLTWRQQSAKVEPNAMTEEAAPPAESAPMADMGSPEAAGSPHEPSSIGVDWVVPKKWINQVGSGMRLATYLVPGGDSKDDAECAVYHFPPGQGGGVDANLDRWSGEFDKIAKQDSKRRTINGLKLATLEITGTFSGHTMKSEDATGARPSWGMIGAIVEGPSGNVIFKLTGPATTVGASKAAFEEMLSSLHTH